MQPNVKRYLLEVSDREAVHLFGHNMACRPMHIQSSTKIGCGCMELTKMELNILQLAAQPLL